MTTDRVAPATTWLADNLPDACPPFRLEPVPGGSSNPTLFVTDSTGERWVLRRPPAGRLLPSAQDMGREFRVQRALHAAGFPVPEPVLLCDDAQVLGAPFYVMRRVDGLVVRTVVDLDRLLRPEARWRAATDVAATLAQLHALDPEPVGLGDLGRREDYLARQLKRWRAQLEASVADSRVPQPGLTALYDRLLASIPAGGPTGIVHRDFWLGNVIVAPDGRLRAVLEWELCTLGATMADAAHLPLSWIELLRPLPEGLPETDELAAAYLAGTASTGADFDCYLAFAAWRVGCILAGVHARYAAGAGAGDRVDLDGHLARIDRLVTSESEP